MIKLNKTKWYQDFVTVISYSFMLLFLYAATSKLLEYDKFVAQIGQSPMLTKFAGLLAWMVPAGEIIIAVLLVFDRLRLIGLFASFSLMAMFSTYIFIILNYTEKIPCSCGGVLEYLQWGEHLLFNILFVALAVIGITLHDILLRNESGVSLKARKNRVGI